MKNVPPIKERKRERGKERGREGRKEENKERKQNILASKLFNKQKKEEGVIKEMLNRGK